MTAIPETQRLAARRLREAAELVSTFMPAGPDRVDILRRVGLVVAAMERDDGSTACRRCGRVFGFAKGWFIERGLAAPRHCPECRAARKAERTRAGVAFDET